MTDIIVIDGSQGEGGGQVLRTALTLSMVSGKAFRMFRIRALRRRPGLRRQHLTAVRAAKAVSSAQVEGAGLGASEITFAPGETRPGDYHFDIGTAGSTTLIAQTLVPALMLASAGSRLTLQGGTHNPMCPSFEFLDRAYLPILNLMGAGIRAELVRPGYYPAGGGCVVLSIEPATRLTSAALRNRGRLVRRAVHATVSRLPLNIAYRELGIFRDEFGWPEQCLFAHDELRSSGPGNVVNAILQYENLTQVFTGFGQRGRPAERVARDVAARVSAYVAAEAAVETHLADQLLVPMAIAGGGSFTTLCPSLHTTTNSRIIETFLPVRIHFREIGTGTFLVDVASADRIPAGEIAN